MAGSPCLCGLCEFSAAKRIAFLKGITCLLPPIIPVFVNCESMFHQIIWYYLAFCQFTAHLRSKFLILSSLYLQHLSVVKWIFCASPLLGVRQCRRMTCKSKLSKCALWLHNIFSPSIGTAQIDNRWWVGVVVYVWFWCKYAASRQ